MFGLRQTESRIATGDFSCPACGHDTHFRRIRIRKRLVLAFVPTVPIATTGDYVECQACAATFKPEVLALEPGARGPAAAPLYEIAVFRAMIAMMAADGEIHDDEIATVMRVQSEITGKTVGRAEVVDFAAANAQGIKSLQEELTTIAMQLNAAGKESVIRALVMVAGADGRLDGAEAELLAACGKTLGLPKSRVAAILADGAARDPIPLAQPAE